MHKKIILILIMVISFETIACAGNKSNYTKYQADYFELFDTHIEFIGYAKSKKEFKGYSEVIKEKLLELNNLYDIYNNYDGISNIKTINDNAGIAPVIVDQAIIDLVFIGKNAYKSTNGAVNIALGPVLRLWHDARTKGKENPTISEIPSYNLLVNASKNTDINDVIIDETNNSVYLSKKGMSLDIGAIAKGYAAMLAINEAKKMGLTSGIINAGGNVITIGKPMDGVRDRWGVGIQEPKKTIDGVNNIQDTIFTNDLAVVTSGDYQRFFIVNGKSYHHIIDPTTLMPADRYAAVTVLYPDSGIADMLSTAIFILPIDAGKAILKEWNAQAFWIMKDGSMEATDGYKSISKYYSGYSSINK